jgi:hypothetical protein
VFACGYIATRAMCFPAQACPCTRGTPGRQGSVSINDWLEGD